MTAPGNDQTASSTGQAPRAWPWSLHLNIAVVALLATLPIFGALTWSHHQGLIWPANRGVMLLAIVATFLMAVAGGFVVAMRIGLSILELAHRAETAVFGTEIPEGSRFAGEVRELKGLGAKIASISSEVRERRDSEMRMGEELAQMVLTDPLTGIGNRQRLSNTLHALSKAGAEGVVMLIDLDHFKEVNDRFGHLVGDQVIREAASRIQKNGAQASLVARIGGDEFAVVIEGSNALAMAEALAEQLVRVMSEPIKAGDAEARIGASVGLAPLEDSPERSMHSADLALYRVKQRGRGGHVVFDAEFKAEIEAEKRLERHLHEALEQGQIVANFQPRVDLKTGDLTGFEALARLRIDGKEPILPPGMISTAESTGLIIELGEALLREAVEQAAGWRDGLHVSVNIAHAQLVASDFAAKVTEILNTANLPPYRLELEITENALLENIETTMAGLLRLKAIGCHIVMDDFFSGHTSLKLIRNFPFDRIKLDRSFVADIATDSSCAAIVRAVLGLCRELAIETTATGVETEAQRQILASAGCSDGQGFLFGQPVSPEAALALSTWSRSARPNRVSRQLL